MTQSTCFYPPINSSYKGDTFFGRIIEVLWFLREGGEEDSENLIIYGHYLDETSIIW